MEVIKLGQKAVNRASEIIKKGGVVIFPTDTVYGFLSDAINKKAVEQIFKIKKRSRKKPLAVFVKDIKTAQDLAEINKNQEKTLKKYWPGKFTFILKLKSSCEVGPHTNFYGIEKNTIALRIPKHKFLNDLLKKINKPLAQTSVNISGLPAETKIGEIIKQFYSVKPYLKTSDRSFRGQVDLIIDAGDLPKSKPSKIIDLTQKRLTRIR